ncbi:MAG: extracellular solute-binding protein [Nitrososphaeria archaeon]|nr:extracellular solute-binding protein [Nitrososphaeria archaeon]
MTNRSEKRRDDLLKAVSKAVVALVIVLVLIVSGVAVYFLTAPTAPPARETIIVTQVQTVERPVTIVQPGTTIVGTQTIVTTAVVTTAPTTPAVPPEKKVTWATIAGFYTDWAAQVAKKFEERTGIKVEIIPIDYSVLYEKQMIELAGRTGAYDIVTIESMCISEWAAAGWLEPLNKYIERDADEVQYEDILPHYRWVIEWNDMVWALPYYTYDHGVFYRADAYEDETVKQWFREWVQRPETNRWWNEWRDLIIKRAEAEDECSVEPLPKYCPPKEIPAKELKVPGPERTWWEMVVYARFFYEEKRDPFPYGIGLMGGPVESNDEWMSIMWSLGGTQFDQNYHITANATAGVMAMEIYVEMLKYAPPGALASSYDEVVAQFQQGLIPNTGPLYLDQWPNVAKTAQRIQGARPEPAAPVGGKGYIGTFALGMASASHRKEYAWEFLKFITGPEGQYEFAKGGGTTCRKSVLLNPEFDPDKNPATWPYTAHYKDIAEIAELLYEWEPAWQRLDPIFNIPLACKFYLESKVKIGSIAAGQFTPKGGLDSLSLAYATILGWGYPVPSMSPPPTWKPPPE